MRSERILVVLKPNYLGDGICATPLLRQVCAQFREPHALASPLLRTLFLRDFANLTLHDQVRSRSPLDLFRSARQIRQARYDIALIVNRSIRAALMVRLAGVRTRVGINAEGRALLLTHAIPHREDVPEAVQYGALGEAIELPGGDARVHLTVAEEEKTAILQGAKIGIHPGASHVVKQIPHSIAPVLDELHEAGFPLAMFGGKGEEHAAEALQKSLKNPAVDLVGKTGLRESLGAMSQLRAMIGGSSGVMHMGVAAGAPTLGVFGPHRAVRWGHQYPPHRTIQIPSGVMQDLDVDQFRTELRALLGIS